jgi:ABC-type antimicrobial peptide transport system permease subunit
MVNKIEKEKMGEVTFSFSEALQLSYQHIRKRPTRSFITLASITLGITFTVVLFMMNALQATQASENIGSHQYWLVIISLSVTVISITNSMLIAVNERNREIGTMKCLGALDQHILKLFLTEALIISIAGGISGFIIGTMVSFISGSIQLGISVVLNAMLSNIFSLFLVSITLSISLSVVATLYPAYRAAKLNPVNALRYEI